MRSTRLIVDCEKLKHNITELKRGLKPGTHMMAIVKANAYGHGALAIARASLLFGADWLGVATPEEGVYLRRHGITADILVLGAANEDEMELSVQYGIHQTVFSAEHIKALNNIAASLHKTAFAQIKVNTGMNRIGISDEGELLRALEAAKASGNVITDGIFTHFATADEEDTSFAKKQEQRFRDMLGIARNAGMDFEFIHASNTAGALMGFGDEYNTVRLGIGLYGYYPSEYCKRVCGKKLLPIASFVTNISAINNIKKGESVSYGAIFTAERDSVIATLPVGYADGYSRRLGNNSSVIINGTAAPVVGRVCMDQMMVDITDIPNARVGDEVMLMGASDIADIDADGIAEKCGTIPYEVLTSIAQRVERVYI